MSGQNRIHMMGVVAVAVFLVWGVFQTPFAIASSTECNNESIEMFEIDGNVIVPEGAWCTLDNVTVNGNVTAGWHATLTLQDSTVNGNVTVTKSTGVSITIAGTTINGNVILKDNTDTTITIDSSHILMKANSHPGNIDIANCTGAITITSTEVVGNLSLKDNESDPFTVTFNMIGGDLVVKGNAPEPCGSDNTVGGQCVGSSCSTLLLTDGDSCEPVLRECVAGDSVTIGGETYSIVLNGLQILGADPHLTAEGFQPFTAETCDWTSDSSPSLLNIFQTGVVDLNNGWDEEHVIPSLSTTEATTEVPPLDHLELSIDHVETIGELVDNTKTLFDSGDDGGLTYALRIYRSDGSLADCIAWGHDVSGMFAGQVPLNNPNGPTNLSQINAANCADLS